MICWNNNILDSDGDQLSDKKYKKIPVPPIKTVQDWENDKYHLLRLIKQIPRQQRLPPL